MKYKIITDGESFKIKYKYFLFWVTIGQGLSQDFFPEGFKTEKEAKEFARARWATLGIRIRKWRIV